MAHTNDNQTLCRSRKTNLTSYNRDLSSNWTLPKLCNMLYDKAWQGKPLIDALMKEEILPSQKSCPKCKEPMRCWKTSGHPHGADWNCARINKKNKRKCDTTKSVRDGTLFSNSRLTFAELLILIYMWWNGFSQQAVADTLRIKNRNTLTKWFRKLREIAVQSTLVLSEPIGGPGKTVEIDESKFGKRKYNRGRKRDGVWVFGGVERGSNQSFLVPVKDRKASTLIPIIKHFIRPGTHIISDCWRAYSTLADLGYTHETVNHSHNFVDPRTGAHTNTVEGMWAHAKRDFIRGGRNKKNMYGYLATFMLQRKLAQDPYPFISFIRRANEVCNNNFPEGNHSLNLPGTEDCMEDILEESSDLEDIPRDLEELVEDFRQSTESSFMEFPASLTSQEKRVVYNSAQAAGLHHLSVGTGFNRRVRIRRSLATKSSNSSTYPLSIQTVPLSRKPLDNIASNSQLKRACNAEPILSEVQPPPRIRMRKVPTHLDDYIVY